LGKGTSDTRLPKRWTRKKGIGDNRKEVHSWGKVILAEKRGTKERGVEENGAYVLEKRGSLRAWGDKQKGREIWGGGCVPISPQKLGAKKGVGVRGTIKTEKAK